MQWLRVFKHLLPTGRAWQITTEKSLRQFFEGLSGLPLAVRAYIDAVWGDLDPATTRALTEWESQWGLPSSDLTTQQRRDRYAGVWKALGGQNPRYIQDTLQNAGFNVYVHEWWADGTDWPSAPTVRNPFDYLASGSGATNWSMFDGHADAQDGDSVAQDGGSTAPTGYPLVNIISTVPLIGDGSEEMQDGGANAQDGGGGVGYVRKRYAVPNDPTKYPYFLYIGGETFPDHASVPSTRRAEFEALCLKICPTQLWLGILVTYS